MKEYIVHLSIPIDHDDLMDMSMEGRFQIVMGQVMKTPESLFLESIVEYKKPEGKSGILPSGFHVIHHEHYK
jgi:hypothetical protein